MSLIRIFAAAALLTFTLAAPVLAAPYESVDGSYVFNTNEDGPN